MGKVKRVLHLDFETRSSCDLPKTGAYIYAIHPTTEPLCVAWAVGDSEPELWTKDQAAPIDLFLEIEEADEIVAHNALFEYQVWNYNCVPRKNWPALPLEKMSCTVAMSYAMGLPGSLDNASRAVGIKDGKDMEGSRIMRQLSQPRDFDAQGNPIWWDLKSAKDEKDFQLIAQKFERLHEYCRQDVRTERELHARVFPLSEYERKVWLLDAKINLRGLRIDRRLAEKAIKLVDFEQELFKGEIRRVSQNRISTPNAIQQIVDFLQDFGVPAPALDKQEVTDMLEIPGLPEPCVKVLELRQGASKSSTAKLKAMIEGASLADDRVRGGFQYHGAPATGRWAGRRVQLQNLPRPKLSPERVEKVLELIGRIA